MVPSKKWMFEPVFRSEQNLLSIFELLKRQMPETENVVEQEVTP
jgi:hypothetical protein